MAEQNTPSSTGNAPNSDVEEFSFERAIEELESIVRRLEDGKVPLEESVAIYERGEALKRRCEELLRQAEARVDKITTDASGQPTGTEPLDVQYRRRPRVVAASPRFRQGLAVCIGALLKWLSGVGHFFGISSKSGSKTAYLGAIDRKSTR